MYLESIGTFQAGGEEVAVEVGEDGKISITGVSWTNAKKYEQNLSSKGL